MKSAQGSNVHWNVACATIPSMSRSRIALLVWLMLWIAVIPLFHSHTHSHDLATDPQHSYGVIHTVFSFDSGPQHQQPHNHVGPKSLEREDVLPKGLEAETAGVHELEVPFLVTPDRKPQPALILVACSDATIVLPDDGSMRGPPAEISPHLLMCVPDNRSPRAPPVLLF